MREFNVLNRIDDISRKFRILELDNVSLLKQIDNLQEEVFELKRIIIQCKDN
jgi:hypothetical protein